MGESNLVEESNFVWRSNFVEEFNFVGESNDLTNSILELLLDKLDKLKCLDKHRQIKMFK